MLEEGIYPDLMAMGCSSQAALKSLRIINIVSKADKYTDVSPPFFFLSFLFPFVTIKMLGICEQ